MNETHLKELLQACVVRGQVTLASGKTSDFYVDGRKVTINSEGSRLVGEAILDLVQELGVTAVGGPTTGACPMVSATGVLAAQAGIPLKLFYVRAVAKGHGLQKAIEGAALDASDRVLLVDDVLTSGGSLVKAVERVREETPAKVKAAFVLVDRQAGGEERLAEADIALHAFANRAQLS